MRNSCKIYYTDQILVNIPAGFTGTLQSVLFENGTESTECRSFPCVLHVCLKECHWRALFTHLFMSIYYMRIWNKMNLQLISRGFKKNPHTFNYAYIYVCSLQSGGGNSWYIINVISIFSQIPTVMQGSWWPHKGRAHIFQKSTAIARDMR